MSGFNPFNNLAISVKNITGNTPKRGRDQLEQSSPSPSQTEPSGKNARLKSPSESAKNLESALKQSEVQNNISIMDANTINQLKSVITELLDEKFGAGQQQLLPAIQKLETEQSALRKSLEDEKRCRNVVINGIAEEANEDMDKQIEKACKLFEKIGVQGVIIDDVMRIGRASQGGGPRPLLVKLLRMADKKRIMKDKKKIGRAEKIYINHDLTAEQRSKEKQLRDHFKGMRTADNSLRMGISKGVMTIWKDGAITDKLEIQEDGSVSKHQPRPKPRGLTRTGQTTSTSSQQNRS